MSESNKLLRLVGAVFATVLLVLGCAIAQDRDRDGDQGGKDRPEVRLVFDANGKFRILGGQPLKLPVEVKALEDLSSITVARVRGSHYVILCDPYGCYKWILPH